MSNLIQQAHDLHVALLDILRRMDLPDDNDDAYNDYYRDKIERMLDKSERRVTRRIAAALAQTEREALERAAQVAERTWTGSTAVGDIVSPGQVVASRIRALIPPAPADGAPGAAPPAPAR